MSQALPVHSEKIKECKLVTCVRRFENCIIICFISQNQFFVRGNLEVIAMLVLD